MLVMRMKAYNIYIPPQVAYHSCSSSICHRQSGHTAYRPRFKPTPTDFNLQPDNHTQPWSAVWWSQPP